MMLLEYDDDEAKGERERERERSHGWSGGIFFLEPEMK